MKELSIAAVVTTVDPARREMVQHLVHNLLEAPYEGVRTVDISAAYDVRIDRPEVRVFSMPRPLPRYVVGLNEALRDAPPADLYLVLNDDLAVRDRNWLLEVAAAHLRHPNALLGAKLYRPNGQVQHAGGFLLRHAGGIMGGHYGEVIERGTPAVDFERPVEFVTGAFLVIPRTLWELAGPFDASLPAWEDSDFAYAVRAKGGEVWYVPRIELTHVEGTADRVKAGRQDAYLETQKAASEAFLRKWFPTASGRPPTR